MEPAVYSMTGVGAAVSNTPLGSFSIDVRSVNHRFLKTTVRVFASLPGAEAAVEERIRSRIRRGHVSAYVRFAASRDALTARIDDEAFGEVAAHLTRLAERHGLPGPATADVLLVPGVQLEAAASTDAETALPAALEAVDAALDGLVEARKREGGALADDIRAILERIAEETEAIDDRAAELPSEAQKRLQGRIEDLLTGSGVEPDPEQLARAVALLADRADIREEITRLRAHLEHAREVLERGDLVGRRLDFLVQEMHRETNTIGSKVADSTVSRHVVEMKSDVERLREQVQNLE